MKKLWILVSLVLIGCLGCVVKPVYELPTAVGFRMGDKDQLTALVTLIYSIKQQPFFLQFTKPFVASQ